MTIHCCTHTCIDIFVICTYCIRMYVFSFTGNCSHARYLHSTGRNLDILPAGIPQSSSTYTYNVYMYIYIQQ